MTCIGFGSPFHADVDRWRRGHPDTGWRDLRALRPHAGRSGGVREDDLGGSEGRARAGKTTALIYTGVSRNEAPQDANGGHNLMAHATVEAIARELAMLSSCPCCPTLRTMQNRFRYHRDTNELLAAMLERLTEQAILNGFRNVILMGDHAGGQPQVYRGGRQQAQRHATELSVCSTVTRSIGPQ